VVVTTDTERVWAEFHSGIEAFVRRRLRNPADVDDVVQRVFLQVHRALPTLRNADRLHAWIYQMTRRAIIDYYRSPVSRREVAGGGALDLAETTAPVERPDAGDEPSALQELSRCLRPLLVGLPDGDREALRLVEVEGLTQVEAARRLGLSTSGMKSRVQRARFRLRSVVEACCRIELDRRGGVVGYASRGGDCGTCGPADGGA
jgi:RNA polymerase sigma-70 factor (ECF subfamily)